MKKRIILIPALIALALSITFTSVLVICSSGKKELYEMAIGQLNAKAYVKAAESFATLGNYKDSKEKAWECFYIAEKMIEEKTNYYEAFLMFLSLSENFKEAAENAHDTALYATIDCIATKDYSFVEKLFDKIDNHPIFDSSWKETFYNTVLCGDTRIIRPEILLIAWGYDPYNVDSTDGFYDYTIKVNNKTLNGAFKDLKSYYESNYRIDTSYYSFSVYNSDSDKYEDIYVSYSSYDSDITIKFYDYYTD